MELLLVAGLSGLIGAVWWLLRKILKPEPEEEYEYNFPTKGGGDPEVIRNANSGPSLEELATQASARAKAEAEAEERRLAAKADKIQKILEAEPLLKQSMQKQAGIGGSYREMQLDREMILRIARGLDDKWLRFFSVAASQTDLDFDLESSTEKVDSLFPTRHISVEPIDSYDQLPMVLPEQLMQDEDLFLADLVQQNLFRLRFDDFLKHQKLLYILLDYSPSMQEQMSGGMTRHMWARAVCMNLLLRALRGDAKYYFRFFDDGVARLHRATTPAEAQELVDYLMKQGEGSGTNIYGAFTKALSDRRSLGGDIENADILIISDGEDPGMPDATKLMADLGFDTNLHAALIGSESDLIKSVAKTYKSFR